jgi:hypothetical protein
MRPIPQANGSDVGWLFDKPVSGFAAMIDDRFVGLEDKV